jgi:hypothetical protein
VLIRKAAIKAIEDGSERITQELLDDTEIDLTADAEYAESEASRRPKSKANTKSRAARAAPKKAAS